MYRVWWVPWWLIWHLCLYICEKCEMSRLWRTDRHTDGRTVESRAVFSLSWIRNIKLAWWMEPTVRLYLHFPSPGVQRKRSMGRRPANHLFCIFNVFVCFCLYFGSWVLFHFVFLHFPFRKVERKRSMGRWGDEGPLLRKCFAESSAPLVPIVTF